MATLQAKQPGDRQSGRPQLLLRENPAGPVGAGGLMINVSRAKGCSQPPGAALGGPTLGEVHDPITRPLPSSSREKS